MIKKPLFAVLILALLFHFTGCSKNTPAPSVAPKAVNSAASPATQPSQRILYYFHRTVRCNECLAMELFARELLDNEFDAAVQDGFLTYHVVNIDDPGNEHYASDFDLSYSALVLVAEDESGNALRWKNLEEAWDKSHNQEAFIFYMTTEIAAWLKD